MNEKPIKDCPFCGAFGEIMSFTDIEGIVEYYGRCSNWECPVGPETDKCDTWDEALEIWNHRVPE